ncbi:toprim domain-containing protein [candidate division WWE3 bacterium]|uniref:Toprim domain-containing protein n=1 Tax=candidate division WWE3 bacterium TaxID=2053526 RepID=A0A955LFU7_UNCKA|nr:toprim domain-containing protein [candidate division WWE3 bacterium]
MKEIQTIPIKEYLAQKNIPIIREAHGELIAHCIFNGCDEDSRGKEAHLYFNNDTSQYHCKKCDSSGNIFTLAEYFGDSKDSVVVKPEIDISGLKKQETPEDNQLQKLTEQYHQQMPEHIRDYLNERGIPDFVIENAQLGYGKFYGKSWITIPIFDSNGATQFFKLRKDPQDSSEGAKYMTYPQDSKASLYDLRYLEEINMAVICEGELDCLVLWANGIPAITSTAGATTFKSEWAPLLVGLEQIYICLDKDEAGEKGTEKLIETLSENLPETGIYSITLPERMTEGKDITDYFVQYDGNPDELIYDLPKWVAGKKPIDTSKFPELTPKDVMETLGLTIKRDDQNKLVTFLCQLSAFTENAQFNISFNAPSSTGKSYIPTEIAQLFPQDDVIEIGYCSPTAFFHDVGSWNDERKGYEIDLSRKILIFLDQPHTMLLERLRPLLSHDKKEMQLKITDKSQKHGLRTKNVFVKGYPSVIFCSAGLKIDEQESTRFLLLSPETSQEKLREGVLEKIKKEADAHAYYALLNQNEDRSLLMERIKAVKNERIDQIKISNPETIQDLFFEGKNILKPRHQRDIGRLISIVKSFALLNLWFREREGNTVIANERDIQAGAEIWEVIAESQEYNLPPFIYNLYKDIILAVYNEKNQGEYHEALELGVSRQEILQKHYDVYERMLPDWQLRQEVLPMLETAGLITQEQDENDKRKKLVFPTTKKNKSNDNQDQKGGDS